MIYDLGFLGELGSGTNKDLFIPFESSSGDISESTGRLPEAIKELNPLSDSTISVFSFEENWLGAFAINKIISSEIRQFAEIDWSQDRQYPSDELHQLTPISIEKEDNVVTATYDDGQLHGIGSGASVTISHSYTRIVAYFEELKVTANHLGDLPVENYHSNLPLKDMFRQIMGEVEPKEWQELKQVYGKRLEEIPHVQKGYIKIDGNDADVIIVLSEYSVDRIEQLAEIDLEIDRKFRPLHFFVEYKLLEDYLELNDFERFY